jgi:hypothetical protein
LSDQRLYVAEVYHRADDVKIPITTDGGLTVSSIAYF